jgi:hypothetical protein
MYFEKIHNKGQARLFKNQYLEMLTKTHPLVIWGIYLPIIVYMLYYSGNHFGYSIFRIGLTFLGGMVFWSLFEYIAHPIYFSLVWLKERQQKNRLCSSRESSPLSRDRERLFMPPVPSLIIASVVFSLMYLLMRSNVFMFFPGIYSRIPYVRKYALRYSCMESSISNG